ncbi:MAG TPA: bifunctional indole-3-glycerol phosphate synthase/phosphoribosylanthranilate isomerase [Treponemataceae bacterium]|nr:bifunctional indole-3-glycerol phosphate synthase/phosphoribosylanthranilate isomerase [Treponemataceae bacterium]
MALPQQPDILSVILEKRKALHDQKGFSFGHSIPLKREKPVVPFLPEKGAILEVKRASPSRGDIAPFLNAAETACTYAEQGAGAISVLTEETFFKGSLEDLCAVSEAVYKKNPGIAILRKDFLVEEEEIDISYSCGADAVLLIARILETEKLCSMAKKALSLGLSILCEIREEEDLGKYHTMCRTVQKGRGQARIFLGINTRDLATFVLDPLVPSSFFYDVEEGSLMIYESGVKTVEAAAFAGNMGFHGLLMGEAAAKNPGGASALVTKFKDAKPDMNAVMWTSFAAAMRSRRKTLGYAPYVKICGLTDIDDVEDCIGLGADMIGFIFSAKSKRCVHRPFLLEVKELLAKEKRRAGAHKEKFIRPVLTGVITDPESPEAQEAFTLIRDGLLDKIQFHGCPVPPPAEKKWKDIPRYAAVKMGNDEDVECFLDLLERGQPRVLVDARSSSGEGGTGERIDEVLLDRIKGKTQLWLAGGITPANVEDIILKYRPELIDIASGVEETAPPLDEEDDDDELGKKDIKAGKKDRLKMVELFEKIEDACDKVRLEA